jgi:hypothetical protein
MRELSLGVLIELTTAIPILLPMMLVLICVGLGFFMLRLRKRDTREEDEASAISRRNMTALACIGINLFIIAYVGGIFLLFQFLVDHLELLR